MTASGWQHKTPSLKPHTGLQIKLQLRLESFLVADLWLTPIYFQYLKLKKITIKYTIRKFKATQTADFLGGAECANKHLT